MPELPEVETTRRGISPLITGRIITDIIIRQPKLRWKVPRDLKSTLDNQSILDVERRAKYLLIKTTNGTLIVHLGMSGSLRVIASTTPPLKHDHFDLVLDDGQCLRLRDPRRFGAILWTAASPLQHKLLNELGVEPLEGKFCGEYLFDRARNKKCP